ncbi:hypothetical protein C0J52_09655 [Blattella germanica]|nr:hypothetical protein C0J52_09655 [Blattella germanica]
MASPIFSAPELDKRSDDIMVQVSRISVRAEEDDYPHKMDLVPGELDKNSDGIMVQVSHITVRAREDDYPHKMDLVPGELEKKSDDIMIQVSHIVVRAEEDVSSQKLDLIPGGCDFKFGAMASPGFKTIEGDHENLKELIRTYMRCFSDKSEARIDLIPGVSSKLKAMANPTFKPLGEEDFKDFVECTQQAVCCFADKNEAKIDLIPGAYRDENGKPWVMPFIRKLEEKMLKSPEWNHEYVIFMGLEPFNRLTPTLVLGKDSDALKRMIEDLQNAPENSVIVLQVCAHNPTGCDLTKQQWIRLADVMKERKLFPFFDAAYQGLGSGDLEEDVWPVRYFIQQGFELFIAQSSSKNMGLYGCRTGCLTVVLKEGRQEELAALKLMTTVIIRALYLCPTRHGAEIVINTLQNPEITKEWHECLKKMVTRLKSVRQGLKERLLKLGTPGTWEHITDQIGMFSFTGLTRKQAAYLADNHHIYLLPNGRANMCALNEGNLDRFANAVHEAIIKCPE